MKKSYDFKTIKYLANSINPNNKEFLIDILLSLTDLEMPIEYVKYYLVMN